MKTNAISYRGYLFPREIISHGVWLYHRFALSFREVEELLAKRAQRFLSAHGVVHHLFRLGRHLMRATNYRTLRERSFKEWSAATGA